jgi:hypothetical protein
MADQLFADGQNDDGSFYRPLSEYLAVVGRCREFQDIIIVNDRNNGEVYF